MKLYHCLIEVEVIKVSHDMWIHAHVTRGHEPITRTYIKL